MKIWTKDETAGTDDFGRWVRNERSPLFQSSTCSQSRNERKRKREKEKEREKKRNAVKLVQLREDFVELLLPYYWHEREGSIEFVSRHPSREKWTERKEARTKAHSCLIVWYRYFSFIFLVTPDRRFRFHWKMRKTRTFSGVGQTLPCSMYSKRETSAVEVLKRNGNLSYENPRFGINTSKRNTTHVVTQKIIRKRCRFSH